MLKGLKNKAMSYLTLISEWISKNPGKATGGIIGFVFGILIFTIGIIKTLLILLFVLIGFVIGKSRDDNVSLLDGITGLFKRKKEDDLEEIDIDDIS